jgi:hypothetical protein
MISWLEMAIAFTVVTSSPARILSEPLKDIIPEYSAFGDLELSGH